MAFGMFIAVSSQDDKFLPSNTFTNDLEGALTKYFCGVIVANFTDQHVEASINMACNRKYLCV